ncbi:MAG: Fe-S cluster assembly protein SufD [Microbacterium sp.]|uniref:Fe-S cluster assembly protein SufD n=1 Tax=Microbacterium sp. TaxID=51671 RepID=UPI0039E5966F
MSSTTTAPGQTEKGHIDPAAAFVPVQTRSERPASFDPADFGTPTGREVNWKHTPLDRIAPLLVADAVPDEDALVTLITGHEQLEVGQLAAGEAPRGEVFVPEDVVAAAVWQRDRRASLLRVPAGVELAEPVTVEVHGRPGTAFEHLVIEAQPNSRATIVLRHDGETHLGQNVEIIVREGAALTLVSVQRWGQHAVHLASHQARVERSAALTHVVVSLGGGVVRVNPSVELAGAGAEGRLFGLAFADAGQHLESQVYLHHEGPHTVGDVLYKAALQGASARTVWIGDVLIGPDAVGTDSYEANRNLVLTEGARADSIPNLEIETGDILGAGHASATGRFDDEQLFYLQARGIREDEARRLVVLGFLSEIAQKTGIPALEDELVEAIERELAEGAAA